MHVDCGATCLHASAQPRRGILLAPHLLRCRPPAELRPLPSHPAPPCCPSQIEGYPNLIEPVVEAIKFIGPLSADMVTYAILNRMSRGGCVGRGSTALRCAAAFGLCLDVRLWALPNSVCDSAPGRLHVGHGSAWVMCTACPAGLLHQQALQASCVRQPHPLP